MISLVIPNYNKREYVADMLESVLAQTAVTQIILVDDASADGSGELLQASTARDPRIEFLRMDRNRNASYCRNRGLDRVTGKYVIFFDSDDLLAPHCCQRRLECAEKYPDNDLWVFPMRVFRESPKTPVDTWIPRTGNQLKRFLAHRLPWSVMQPMWRLEFLKHLGGFDESFVRLQDPELHVRALLAGARVKCFPDAAPDCFYRAFRDDGGDASQLSIRNLNGSLHFYRTFIDRVPAALRRPLGGTLFASLSQHVHWHRSGRLSAEAFTAASGAILAACKLPWQRRLLATYVVVQRMAPLHVPGINVLTRMAMGIPS